jgi:hypothetical protein
MRAKMKASQEKKRTGIKSYPINAQSREDEVCNRHHAIHPGQIKETISKRVKSILARQPENAEALQGNWQPDTRDKYADRSYTA